jgi:catechol 2,3-dioxygenase-like lactoylglutathione lyase family enzyme
MADGVRIGSVLMFVQNLDRSVAFYTDVLALAVADRSPTAALLTSATGSHLILRSMSTKGAHPLGAVGIQYVVWTAAGKDDLDRAEQALRRRSSHRVTHVQEGCALVEGRDPDDLAVMIIYPGPDQVPPHALPARIYGW